AKPRYSISNIRAYLYYDDTGEIDSQNLIGLSPGSLHNTVIGEGIAKRPANTTLVLVEISGPSFANQDVGTLTLQATGERYQAGKQTLSKVKLMEQRVDLNLYFQETQRKILIPFWLYETGGSPVVLTATLKGGKDNANQSMSLSKT